MPYYNSLAKKYSLAAQYYAEQHNSISALMWLVAGQPITGNNSTTTCFSADNVVRHLLFGGFTWRSYQEDLPYPGFTGISHLNYVRRHNPIIDFTDSCAPSQAIHSVPYTQLAKDVANRITPNYAYITPNLQHDAHDGTLSAADLWLSKNVPVVLALPEFRPGGDGILFIVWDEGNLSGAGVPQDNRCSSTRSSGCGGRVATLVIGPQVKVHYQSSVLYHHANLLRTVCDAMGFRSCPAGGSSAIPMSDIFDAVNIASPLPNAVVTSPVHIQASASTNVPVNAMQVYVDNALKYQVSGPAWIVQAAFTREASMSTFIEGLLNYSVSLQLEPRDVRLLALSPYIPYFLKADLRLDALRSGPRFKDLTRSVGPSQQG